jgi:hypothetical protein
MLEIVSELQSQYISSTSYNLKPKDESNLFVENLPYFGKVPMLFFIPENSDEASELRHIIE